MESLARVVTLLILGTLLSAILAFTFSAKSGQSARMMTIILGIIANFGGIQLFIADVGLGARFFGLGCAILGMLGVARSLVNR